MKTAVLLSPHFPPSTLAGVHRARHLAKHLPAHGWRPIVVRADPKHYIETPDPALAALVPRTVEDVRTGAVPAQLSRRFGVGDIGVRALIPFARALDRLIAERRPDVVFLTGSPFLPLVLSGRVRRRGVPVVVDLQDPWRRDPTAQEAHAMTMKRRAVRVMAATLEPRALRPANAVTTVSPTQNEALKARYAFLRDRPMAAIPIGGDPEDFIALRDAPPPDPEVRLADGLIHLNYVGAFLPRAVGTTRTVLRALRRLAAREPFLAERLRLNFVGTSNQPAGASGGAGPNAPSPFVLPLAEEEGVAELVTEHAARVPYLEALSLLANADGILMIGSDESHYTASKIYPGLMSGTPYVSLFHAASSAHQILSAAGGGAAFAFSNPEELSALEGQLADALQTLASAPETFGPADPAAYAPYTAHAVAGDYARLFDAIAP